MLSPRRDLAACKAGLLLVVWLASAGGMLMWTKSLHSQAFQVCFQIEMLDCSELGRGRGVLRELLSCGYC